MKIKKTHLGYVGFIMPFLLAVICIASVTFGSHQASLPNPMPQEFVGEYSYDGVNWQPLTPDAELSALEGDLLLRGNILRPMEEGWQLNFYSNHIGVSIKVNGEEIYVSDMLAIPDLSVDLFASMCARKWVNTVVPAIGAEDTVEIRLHNPHKYGNRTAYRDFLVTLCSDPVGWNLLQQNLANYGKTPRVIGGLLVIASLMLFGAAGAAAVAHIPSGSSLLKLGLMTLLTGGYIVYDTLDVSYWSGLNVLNTYVWCLCIILATFCLCHFVTDILTGPRQKIAKIAVQLSAVLNSVLILLSFTGVTAIYDTMPCWAGSQIIFCPVFMICCGWEVFCSRRKRVEFVFVVLMFSAILLDIAGVGASIVWRAPWSKVVFASLVVVHMAITAKGIITNQQASLRAKALEKELEDSRIAIMLSQIKPHFLYNVLNTIYHLYRKEPETAQEAVSSFAEYLRCNMLSIEKNEPIPFSEEYQHIQTYLSLEQIRFRGKLDVIYDVEEIDFRLPPLTVEPLVENAVKHGVMKKRSGGIVTISTRRTAKNILVTVADTGVGFDPEHYMEDGKAHVGIRNVRKRLENTVGGSLSITSTEQGTVAMVTIPIKEARDTR